MFRTVYYLIKVTDDVISRLSKLSRPDWKTPEVSQKFQGDSLSNFFWETWNFTFLYKIFCVEKGTFWHLRVHSNLVFLEGIKRQTCESWWVLVQSRLFLWGFHEVIRRKLTTHLQSVCEFFASRVVCYINSFINKLSSPVSEAQRPVYKVREVSHEIKWFFVKCTRQKLENLQL